MHKVDRPTPARRTLGVLLISVLVGLVLVSGVPVIAGDVPGEPIAVHGAAEYDDGTPLPEGTEVVAVVDGEEVDRVSVDVEGTYAGDAPTDEKLRTHTQAGSTITFHIGDPSGPEATQTHEIDGPGVFELDLTFPAPVSDPPAPPGPSPEPDPDAPVTIEPTENGVSVSVEDAPAGEAIGIPLDLDAGEEATLSEMSITPATTDNFEMTIESRDGPPAAAGVIPNAPVVLQYFAIESSLDAEDIERASFEFDVAADELEGQGVELDDLALHHHDAGEWVERETQALRSEEVPEMAIVEAQTPHFSTFALAGASDIVLADPALDTTELEVGDTLIVEVGAENPGNADLERTVELWIEDEMADRETVQLAAGESAEIVFEHAMTESGTYDVRIDEETVGTVTVLTPADLSIVEASIDADELPVGDDLRVTATVRNDGEQTGTHEAILTVDGEEVDREQVEVAASDEAEIGFDVRLDEPGVRDIAIDGVPAGTVSVVESQDDDSIPGFIAPVAIFALVIAGFLDRRRH